MKSSLWIIAASTVVLTCSCGGNTGSGSKHDTVKKADTGQKKSAVQYDRRFNDVARYIAGLPVKDGHGLGNLAADSTYSRHCRIMNARWAEMEAKRLSKMRGFADTAIYPHIDRKLPFYYPFSGADFLHASTFFPDAPKSLYLALEKPGEFPELERTSAELRGAYLQSVQASLSDIFRRSYFITRQMEKDIPVVKGVIPVFLVFMARQGYEVLNVELTELNAEGKTVARTTNAKAVKGMRITYCLPGKQQAPRTLEYFGCDVSNDGVAVHPEILTHVRQFGKANVFFKAASYLMHNSYMSSFREASLSISAAVLQDDTGYPLRVVKDSFDVRLFGKYVPPIRDFGKGGYQPDLEKLYKAGPVGTLPFSLGYHWWDNNQNYMLFTRSK